MNIKTGEKRRKRAIEEPVNFKSMFVMMKKKENAWKECLTIFEEFEYPSILQGLVHVFIPKNLK